MNLLPEHSVENELLPIFIFVVLGLLIGAEGEYRNKSAGLRTFILVCFGACLFTILSVVIGMAVGAGYISIALLGTLLVLLVLSILTYLEKLIDKNHKITEYTITVSHPEDLRYCEQVFAHHHLKASISKQKYSHGTFTITWILTGKKRNHELLIKVLKNNSRIISYEFKKTEASASACYMTIVFS